MCIRDRMKTVQMRSACSVINPLIKTAVVNNGSAAQHASDGLMNYVQGQKRKDGKVMFVICAGREVLTFLIPLYSIKRLFSFMLSL